MQGDCLIGEEFHTFQVQVPTALTGHLSIALDFAAFAFIAKEGEICQPTAAALSPRGKEIRGVA